MATFNPLFLLVALAHFAFLTSAKPLDHVSTPSLVERGDVCANVPNHQAGTFLKRSTLDHANTSPRSVTDFPGSGLINWCAPGCKTYIRVVYVNEIPAGTTDWPTVRQYLINAQNIIKTQITGGDKIIPEGGWLYGHNWVQNTYGLEILFYNSNNHQLTWGVNQAAVVALLDYFDSVQKQGKKPGAVLFSIVDGPNEVARAAFGVEGQWSQGWR